MTMTLSSSQLEAFSEVAKAGSFSKAAVNLRVTQSALSQRIQNLENELESALIVRDPSGLRLTTAGEELLRYCQIRESLEAECVSKIQNSLTSLGGTVRIAGFSSVMRSVVMPALQELVTQNPQINIEVFVREMHELPRMLTTNEADFIVTCEKPFRNDVASHLLGTEENVLVESTKLHSARAHIYLDHDPSDEITASFFKANGQAKKTFHRNFLEDVYGLIDGVKLGYGRAVLPKHLIKASKELKIVSGFKPLKLAVYLQHFQHPYYSNLQSKVVEELVAKASRFL